MWSKDDIPTTLLMPAAKIHFISFDFKISSCIRGERVHLYREATHCSTHCSNFTQKWC